MRILKRLREEYRLAQQTPPNIEKPVVVVAPNTYLSMRSLAAFLGGGKGLDDFDQFFEDAKGGKYVGR